MPILILERGAQGREGFPFGVFAGAVDPGNPWARHPQHAQSGGRMTAALTQAAVDLYGRVCERVVPVSTPEAARRW